MKFKPRGIHIFTSAFFLSLTGLIASNLRAQEGDEDDRQPTVPPGGMEVFRHKLHEAGFQPLRRFEEIHNNPQKTVIVLMGERSIRNANIAAIHSAVREGAALLVATDTTAGRNFEEFFGVAFTGSTVRADPDDCFLGKTNHPFVRPFKAWRIEPGSPKQIFQELESSDEGALATNIPGVVRIDPNARGAIEPLAGYPFSARDRAGRALDPELDFFAVGKKWGPGRFLVLADHSVFINQMVLRADANNNLLNSNLAFTEGCIEWLKGEERRDRCLFVEDGEIKTDFELPFPDRKDSDLERILKLLMILEKHGNKLVARAEETNFFNRLLTEYVPAREIRRGFLFVVVGFSILFVLLMLTRNSVKPDPSRTLVTPELAAMIPKGDMLRQRFDSLLEVANIYEAARMLIRDFLAGMGAEPDANGLPPKLVVEDGYEDELGLRRRITRLWRIGFDSQPVPIAPADWPSLKEDLQDVLSDADDGWWKFVPRQKV